MIPCGPAAGTLARSERPRTIISGLQCGPGERSPLLGFVARRQPVVRTETREDPGQATPYCDLERYERDTPVIELRSDCHRNFDAVSSG